MSTLESAIRDLVKVVYEGSSGYVYMGEYEAEIKALASAIREAA